MGQSARHIIDGLIRSYQFVSSRLPRRCRFEPSCSEYMRHAVKTLGVVRGCLQGGRRLLRCHPWNAGGYDPMNTDVYKN